MSQNTKLKNVRSIQGDWLARDGDQWRVNIPTHGGHKVFPYTEYGGMTKAFQAADRFKTKMLKQYEEDLDYRRKHGELPDRGVKLNIRNRTGVRGLSRIVTPNRYLEPLIVYCASWGPIKNRSVVSFSTAQYPESECKRLAMLALEHKTKHPETLLKTKKRGKN